MRLTLIWIYSDNREENKKTEESIRKNFQTSGLEGSILIYGMPAGENAPEFAGASVTCVSPGASFTLPEAANDAMGKVKDGYVTVLEPGDTWSDGALAALKMHWKERSIIMLRKIMPDGNAGAFSNELPETVSRIEKLNEKFTVYPFYFGGTFVEAKLFRSEKFLLDNILESERRYFLDLCAGKKEILMLNSEMYFSRKVREGDLTFFADLYEKEFYLDSLRKFWIPYLQELTERYDGVPEFIQHHFMFSMIGRFQANLNNKNKHVMEDGDELEFLNLLHTAFGYIEERNLFNARKVKECVHPDSLKWVFGVLKYGENYHFRKKYLSGKMYYAADDTVFNKVESLKTNIMLMEEHDGVLEIDGTVHPILYSMADEVFFTYNGVKYLLNYNERYSHTKAFGVSLFKTHSFHVSIPLEPRGNGMLFCFAKVNKEPVKIPPKFDSHFSHMSDRFPNSYWCFGQDSHYMMKTKEGGLAVTECSAKERRKQELRLWRDMLVSPKERKKNLLFLGVRMAYFAARPFVKKKPVWMYLDKIYKGGDSSEYLYRYASAQDNDFRHYYLIDKNATDYNRLKKDGIRPLVRGTLKHRLIFLMADMMVISNSTVCVFNGFDMKNSSYVRDLINFHVCCVQHGMSVQKIAVAQNRLRDNTRLYFCASKYEIRNLMHPVYDYRGYNALKLTGVPRYDGLVNNDQKQIMISPTWRMQAAVPVTTSESEQRDYNPLFRESSYYKVFNALINDPRLIQAAKTYGYRIKYVLHPIVSSQVDDFDKNDYVDIIPAVGDMSYEKMFCESSLMVTDFSGIQFDFAYMRKPLVYLHHKDIPQHYEEGSFFYDTMAFGEICHDNDELIDMLIDYMQNGCQMKPEYVKRADDFFFYNDRNNCERIYNTMLEYQDEYIFHKKKAPVYRMAETADYTIRWDDRRSVADQMKAILKDNDIKTSGKNITDYYFNEDLDDKAIVLLGLGHNVRGSLQYILNELNRSDDFEGFTCYVRTDESTEAIVQNYIRDKHWTRTKTLLKDGEYSRMLEKAKYLLTEVFFPEGWIQKEGQVSIDIWHGTPLKKLGLAKNSRNLHKDGNTQRNFINAKYLLYPNDYTRDNMLASYKVQGLLHGKCAMLGYPRTGGMLAASLGDLSGVKSILAPNGEKIYAYMPTWKDYLDVETVVAQSKALLDALDQGLRDDQILYVNLHHKVSDSLDYSGFRHIRKFPPNVDSYELLAATEALITDYSSVFYDYLVLRKQIILYCDDYKLYQTKRGTYMDLMSLPFDKAVRPQEVLDALNRGKTYDDEEAFRTFCTYDTTENAHKLCGLFLGRENGVNIQSIPRTAQRQVLVYSEDCEAGEETKLLHELTKKTDADKVTITVGCEMFHVDENKPSAYPMLREVPVIGTVTNTHMSALGRGIMELYQSGRMDLAAAMEYLKYDFKADSQRMFGNAEFDTILLYDINDPEKLLTLSAMSGRKYLFIQNQQLDAVAAGDNFLRDTLRYLIPRMDAVFTMDSDRRILAMILLGIDEEDIQLFRNVDNLAKLLNDPPARRVQNG